MAQAVSGLVAVYPGTFDPVTNGHLDLVQRCAPLVDRLVVSVLANETKSPLFSTEERVGMLQEVLREFPNVEIDFFDGLLIDYARRKQARLILRGIRAISDYEYELQMALMNRELAPDAETIFMLPAVEYTFVSSRLVKEVCRLGGDVSNLVPPIVLAKLRERLQAGS